MITSMRDLIDKLKCVSGLRNITDKQLESIFKVSVGDLELITDIAILINLWMIQYESATLSKLSKLLRSKDSFTLIRNIFVSHDKPSYYTYGFNPKDGVAYKVGSTILRKRRINILNFGASEKPTPKLNLYKNRSVVLSLKPSIKLFEKTFFYNSNNKDFSDLRTLTRTLNIQALGANLHLINLVRQLHSLMSKCDSFKHEAEVLVNISEIKCKVTKVDT